MSGDSVVQSNLTKSEKKLSATPQSELSVQKDPQRYLAPQLEIQRTVLTMGYCRSGVVYASSERLTGQDSQSCFPKGMMTGVIGAHILGPAHHLTHSSQPNFYHQETTP